MEKEPTRDRLKRIKNLSLVKSEEMDMYEIWTTTEVHG